MVLIRDTEVIPERQGVLYMDNFTMTEEVREKRSKTLEGGMYLWDRK